MKASQILISILGVASLGAGAYAYIRMRPSVSVVSPIIQVVDRSLDAYTIEQLSVRKGVPSPIEFGEPIEETPQYTVYPFSYMTADVHGQGGQKAKRVTGLAHIPADAARAYETNDTSRVWPVIVQFRGYVDPAVYESGIGTKPTAQVFARNGYISLAPDFLGYGGSANPSVHVFEERFQTYTTAMDMLASVSSLSIADSRRVGIWAHSNGGQIALTVLEILSWDGPVALWAPVTAPFPYSILYYTNEAPDHGKAMRKKLSEFERVYDTDAYAMSLHTDKLRATLILHQGTADDAVPVSWSDAFVATLKQQGTDITYYTHPGADHNMQPAWNEAMAEDLSFFARELAK